VKCAGEEVKIWASAPQLSILPRVADAVSYRALRRRLYWAAFGMLVTVVVSASGYYALGDGRWRFADCMYMTVITLATVGYGETLEGMATVPYARLWTVGVILCGSGILVYWVSAFTAIIVESDLRGSLRRRLMDKAIAQLSHHIIVCGAGTTGIHAVRELVATETPFVILDHNGARLHELAEEYPGKILYIVGEATDDGVLEQAGIKRAKGALVMLHDDRDNLFCTLSARALNSRLRIISKAVEHSSVAKLVRAGADRVVSPNFIGGMRLVSEMLRPTVVEFLDTMLRGDDRLRIEEVVIPQRSPLLGSSVRDPRLNHGTGALVLALRDAAGNYCFNPSESHPLEAGASLIVMAHVDDVNRLRAVVAAPG
jgi:voltage-gated potassium channel